MAIKRGMKRKTPPKEEFRFSSELQRSTNKLWGSHFIVPNRVAKGLMDGKSRRVICSLNDEVEYQCALIPHGNGSFVITVNKSLRGRLRLEFGTEMRVVLRKDESTYGLPLPEELKELFRQDEEGNALFHSLTRGRQRTLLYIVGKARTSEKRIAWAIIILNHLKSNKGKINYRQLSESLKSPRHLTGGRHRLGA